MATRIPDRTTSLLLESSKCLEIVDLSVDIFSFAEYTPKMSLIIGRVEE